MNDYVWSGRYGGPLITCHTEVCSKGIKDLSSISEVCFKCLQKDEYHFVLPKVGNTTYKYIRVVERHKVKIENLVATLEELRNGMSVGLVSLGLSEDVLIDISMVELHMPSSFTGPSSENDSFALRHTSLMYCPSELEVLYRRVCSCVASFKFQVNTINAGKRG